MYTNTVNHDDDVRVGAPPPSSHRNEISLLPRNDNFDWIRSANDNHSRTERRTLAQATCAAVDRGWYWHANEQVHLKGADAAETSTSVISPTCGVWPSVPTLPIAEGTEVTKIPQDEGTVLSVALRLATQGREVAAISAASAHHVGGGFSTGGRHALEEAVCVQSTLYRCLRHAWRQTGVPEGSAYIPKDGVVLSPRVEVFREGTAEGYATLPKPVELACVVSVAMPNLNERVRDAPLDKFAKPDLYKQAVNSRWRAMLGAVCSVGATDLVCPDVGCGVYGNEPATVGQALGEVLRTEYWGLIKNLWVVGNDDFCAAVETGVANAEKRGGLPESDKRADKGTLASLKGKLLAGLGGRDPSKAASSRSGASTPTHGTPSEKASDKKKSATNSGLFSKILASRPADGVASDVDAASVHSSNYGNARDGTYDPKKDPQASPTSKRWAPWSSAAPKNKASTASTKDSSDAVEGGSIDDNTALLDAESLSSVVGTPQPQVVKNKSAGSAGQLTDELLKRHLQALLIQNGNTPEESDESVIPNTSHCVHPGQLLHPNAVMISGIVDDVAVEVVEVGVDGDGDGVAAIVDDLAAMLKTIPKTLRTELHRLSKSSDMVIASL